MSQICSKGQNGSKACAWLIYKSAAKLTVRLTPHRHPLAALAGAEAKRTPTRTNKRKPNESAAAAEPSPLYRLGIGCRFSRRAWLSFIVFYRCCLYRYKAARYVTFGSMAITSGLTCPIYSPSTQHPKLSKSKIFLSSRPYGQTISSSMISVTKY